MPDTYDIVNATKLDACCTAEANAIRAKTGSSAQIAFDWSNSKGFADAIAAIPTGGGGITISPMDYSVSIQNGITGTVNITRVLYNSTTLLSAVAGNVNAGSTGTYSDFATDGTHIWFRATPGTDISYNGNPATFDKSSTYFQVTIPSGFDGTIPFVIT